MDPAEFLRCIELFQDSLMILSLEGEILGATHEAAQLIGLPQATLRSRSLLDVVKTDQTQTRDYLRLCGRSRFLVPGTLVFNGAEGPIPCGCDGGSLTLGPGPKDHVIALRVKAADSGTGRYMMLNTKIDELSREIRERKALEEEYALLLKREQAARSASEEASRMKDEFLAIVSHELRTPLNAIIGWATLLSEGVLDVDTKADAIKAIERNAHAQAEIITDLLDLSRIIAGKVRLEVQPCDMADVIQSALETVQPAALAKGVQIHTTLDPSAGLVSGDPGRLQQVIWNLLSNAVKFTANGGRVHVELFQVNSMLQIVVSDTGIGIKPDMLPYVFDRFRQGDSSSTRQHGGLGLGLAIVRQLVELHGGTVTVESAGPGHGSTFTVGLPLRVLREHSAALDQAPTQEARGGRLPYVVDSRLKGLRVLLVEDDLDSRELLAHVIKQFGAEVCAVTRAQEALRELDLFRPDCLLSDIEMPGEDGYSLIRRIRARELPGSKPLPAIAVTAYARAEDRARAETAGFNMHVAKPIDPMDLVTALAKLTKHSPP